MNRWTAPLVTMALLAPGAVLLGWNGAELASAAVQPWTSGPAADSARPAASDQGSAPTVEVGTIPPTSAPTVPAPTPPRTVVLVHKTVHSTVDGNEHQEDDVSTSDELGTPEPTTDPDTTPDVPAPGTPEEPAEGPDEPADERPAPPRDDEPTDVPPSTPGASSGGPASD